MITFEKTHISLTIPIATALLAFAGDDEFRTHLGIGIDDEGYLAATNGYAGLRFECLTATTDAPRTKRGTVWSHAYVKTAIKVARARKLKAIDLQYAEALPEKLFPPLKYVMPSYSLEANEPIGFDPKYIGALATVTKALDVQSAQLVSARGSLDPLGFIVDDNNGLLARAVIMPCRIG